MDTITSAVGRHELDVAGAVAGLEDFLENGEEASAVGLFLEEVAQMEDGHPFHRHRHDLAGARCGRPDIPDSPVG